VRHEVRRRVRIGAGDVQALLWTWRLLLPAHGTVAFAYFSHKILRWLGPWLLITGFTANLFLLDRPVFRWLLLGQVGFYGLGVAAPLVRAAASVARYFIALNVGLGLGFLRFIVGRQRPFWTTTPRTSEYEPVGPAASSANRLAGERVTSSRENAA
jgi:hypothetical protein